MKKNKHIDDPENVFSGDADEIFPEDQATPVAPITIKYCPVCNSVMTVMSRDDVVPDGVGVTSKVTFLYECPYCHYTE